MTDHKVPPSWYGQGYANLPGWDRAVQQCLELLRGWARQRHVGTYGEVVRHVDAIPWPEGAFTHNGSQIGSLLGTVCVHEWLEDRPLLSAIVVQAETRFPGKGFYKISGELGRLRTKDQDSQLIFVGLEQEACFQTWRGSGPTTK